MKKFYLLVPFWGLLALAFASFPASGAIITWTNINGGSWRLPENWEPNLVPGFNDSVRINIDGDYTITVDPGDDIILDNLTLGGTSGTQVLSLNGSVFAHINTMSVKSGGVFDIVGASVWAELVDLSGTMDWAGGSLGGGGLTIATNGLLNITGDMPKFLDDTTAITNYGTIRWSSGEIIAYDNEFTSEHPTVINMAGALFEISNDSTLRLDLWMPNPNAACIVHNAGLLRKVGGPGTTLFDNVRFENSGTVEVLQGTLRFSSSDPVAEALVSSGLFQVSAGAAVELGGGIYIFQTGHQTQGDGFFGLRGMGMSPPTLQGELSGRLDWAEGPLFGGLTIATNGLLNITGDMPKFLDDTTAITNYGTIRWSSGEIIAYDNEFTPEHPTVINMAGALFEISNDSSLRLDLWMPNPNLAFIVQNAGLLRKVGMGCAGTTLFDNVRFENTGIMEVWPGTIGLAQLMSYGSQWFSSGMVRLGVLNSMNYSRIQVYGTGDITGTLEVEFLNGFVPAIGDSFELLTYDFANVAFSNISLPLLPQGLYFSTRMDTNRLVVETRRDPIATPDNFTLSEDTPGNLDVLANDSDLYGPLSLASVTQPSHGVVTLNLDNTVHYIPAQDYFGPDRFSYEVTNADGRLAAATVSVEVAAVNDPPLLALIADQSVDEQTQLTFTASATDIEGDQRTFSLGAGAPVGAAINAATGQFTWTPTEAQGPGIYPITIIVTDNGVPPLSASNTFTVMVKEVNTAPVLTAINDQSVHPAETLSLTFTAADSDLPANRLTWTIETAPSGASVTSDGLFTWTPGFEQAGSTNVVIVRVSDDGSPCLSSSGSFTVVVLDFGLKADYFAGTNFNTLMLTRNDPLIDYDWEANSPAPGVPADQFSVRWTGQIIPQYSQTYTFYVVSSDGVRLWVDGRLVVNNWTLHSTSTNSGGIDLVAGQAYPIKLEYFETSGTAVCRLLWSSTNQPMEVVPESQLACSGFNDVIPNAIYRLTPKLATGKAMEAKNGGTADGTQVTINNWGNKDQQKWEAIQLGEGYFKFIPQHATNKVLEINGGYTTNGTKVQISLDMGTSQQAFKFVDMGQGWFKMIPQCATNSVLNLSGGKTSNGTQVQLYEDNSTDAERWRLDRQ